MIKEIRIPINNISNSRREYIKNIVNILSLIFKTTSRENELLIYIIEELDLYLSKGYSLEDSLKLINNRESRKKIAEKMGFQLAIYRQLIWKLRFKKVLGQKINDPHPLYISLLEKVRNNTSETNIDIVFSVRLPLDEK